MLRLAVDTGGTFTDCVLQDSVDGTSHFAKTLSTPRAPEQAVLEGIEALRAQHGFRWNDLDAIYLATTVATNAILERRGARVGVVMTRGFRDVVLMQRAKRYDTYDLHMAKPRPLVRRRDIVEVRERLDARGRVVTPLDTGSLAAAVGALAERDVEAVAVSLLHAYANPAHERAVGEALGATGRSWPISLSSSVSPKYREYERTSTTIANAYVAPIVARFLDGLENAFHDAGFRGALWVMQSNGGLLPPPLAREFPVHIIESGPAAGVLLGAEVGKRDTLERVFTFDMGGTTAKVGAVEGGKPTVTSTFEVDGINLRQWSGLPLNISAVELVEIGAGGGSIARVEMGTIRVGPDSAGADPGPVCYGRGGSDVTLTDANLLLGYLDPTRFAGGRMSLDIDAAQHALDEQIARPLRLSTMRAAWGVHAVANANMERAMRSMSVERGRDPRDFALVAFGGAGPVHVCRLARALGIREVVIPRGAGVGSAIGMLDAAPRFEAVLTFPVGIAPERSEEIERLLRELEARARGTAGAGTDARVERYASLRYRGQGFELHVALPAPGVTGRDFIQEVGSRFEHAYEQAYGYAQPGKPIEATEWQVTVWLPMATTFGQDHAMPRLKSQDRDRAMPIYRRWVAFPDLSNEMGDERWLECPVFERPETPGTVISGPAIITDPEATIVVPPGDRARTDDVGDVRVSIAATQPALAEISEVPAHD